MEGKSTLVTLLSGPLLFHMRTLGLTGEVVYSDPAALESSSSDFQAPALSSCSSPLRNAHTLPGLGFLSQHLQNLQYLLVLNQKFKFYIKYFRNGIVHIFPSLLF